MNLSNFNVITSMEVNNRPQHFKYRHDVDNLLIERHRLVPAADRYVLLVQWLEVTYGDNYRLFYYSDNPAQPDRWTVETNDPETLLVMKLKFGILS